MEFGFEPAPKSEPASVVEFGFKKCRNPAGDTSSCVAELIVIACGGSSWYICVTESETASSWMCSLRWTARRRFVSAAFPYRIIERFSALAPRDIAGCLSAGLSAKLLGLSGYPGSVTEGQRGRREEETWATKLNCGRRWRSEITYCMHGAGVYERAPISWIIPLAITTGVTHECR